MPRYARPSSLARHRAVVPTLLLAVVALVGASCSSDAEPAATDSAATSTTISSSGDAATSTTTDGTTQETVVPDSPGPHAVGRRTIEVTDTERDRTLNVDVWYPADEASADAAELTRYEFLPTAYVDSDVAKDQADVAADGPFPLLVYSHGSGGVSYAASFNMEHLASYGFVVVAPDHLGNTAFDSVTGASDERDVVAANRPADVSAVLDDVLARTSDDADPLAGAIDAEHIGVFGHSFGGFTSLAVGGGFSNDLVDYEADDRVDAIAGLAPYTTLLSDETFEAIDVPTLLMTGTKDETTPIDPQTERPWDLIGAEPIYRVDLTDAGHQTLTDVCDYQQDIPKLPDAPKVVVDFINDLADSGCGDGFMDHGRAKDLINIYTTAFFSQYVAGDDTYAGVLTETYATASDDIAYQSRPES